MRDSPFLFVPKSSTPFKNDKVPKKKPPIGAVTTDTVPKNCCFPPCSQGVPRFAPSEELRVLGSISFLFSFEKKI